MAKRVPKKVHETSPKIMNRYELYTKEQEAHWERNIRRAKFAVREIVYPGVAEPTPPSPNDANNCFLLHVRPVLKISRSLFFS